MTLVAIIMGALLGAALQPLGLASARFLLSQRGKCIQVSLAETVFTCVALAAFGAAIGVCAQTLPTACFLFVLLYVANIAAFTDYHHRIIPNELVLALIVVRLLFGIPALAGVEGFPEFDLAMAALGCLICVAIFAAPALAGKKVGTGDVKFVAAMGFCLGPVMSLFAVALMGLLVITYMLYARQIPMAQRLKQMVPMAPFLCVAMMVVLLVQVSPATIM